MKLNYAPQVGLRKRRPDNRREMMAFWAGILIIVAFEGVLMAKSWSPASAESVFGFHTDQASEDAGD
jgi:hypothetical protein